METISLLLIAVALAMDSFTVSISGGASLKKVQLRDALLVGAYFGFFQFFMTVLGFGGGSTFSDLISAYDHWVALAILVFIGGKMIIESFKKNEDEKITLNHKFLFVMAIATSIDALGVGLSYAFLDKPIWVSSIVIGVVAFVFSMFGMYLGKVLKQILKNKAEFVGGVILIWIGINIVVEHGAFVEVW